MATASHVSAHPLGEGMSADHKLSLGGVLMLPVVLIAVLLLIPFVIGELLFHRPR